MLSSDAWCSGSRGDHDGADAGLSQTQIAHLIGRSTSAVCLQIALHTGPDGANRAEAAARAAHGEAPSQGAPFGP